MAELSWQKSSFSSGDPNTNCVELAAAPDGTLPLRESDEPAAILTASRPAIRALLSRIKAGNLDLTDGR
jgi:hypothetical protein